MKLELQREEPSEKGTPGYLFVDEEPFCVTLEPPDVAFGVTQACIPAGTYRVEIGYSPRFQRHMPHILDVPGREGILIHWGNYVENTEGCVLVGSSKATLPDGSPAIWNSRHTFDKLYEEIQGAQNEGISLSIEWPRAANSALQTRNLGVPQSVPPEEN